ncbi:stage II sporulation protein R [Anaerocolumna sp. MB42-C2]|uniref:stage II sporulation protein R n=1 Tax=Anaerocolumna sp. MB42-C2 TaxID=3070997 RepID=UPI0027E0E1C8|nr:stage II sporulation protein R [Anaerocolumna sp. MB42-C2]WMJ85284.1 stage II sporulation protein R [Anaerocolumna sp. MB42-C2]
MNHHNIYSALAIHKKWNYKSYIYCGFFSFSVLLVLFTLLLFKALPSDARKDNLQKGIASEIIRFHVIGNSDSAEDQALKLVIKGALTDALRPKLEHVKNINEARSILNNNLDEMETVANRIIKENGYDYTAKATIEKGYFPLKVYGDLSLPPGEYEAVRVELGAAAGQNWWCIMFPPLCFVDSTYSVVPKSSKEELKYLLTDEEYKAVFSNRDTKIKVKFKILSMIKDAMKD